MSKILYLDYCAIVVYALIATAILIRRINTGRVNRMYAYLLITAFYAVIYDVCAVSLDNMHSSAIGLNYLMHCGYIIIRNAITPMFCCYIISLTDTWHFVIKRKRNIVLSVIPFVLIVLLTISSPFTKFIVDIGPDGSYSRGSLFVILYAVAAYYTAFALAYCIYYYKHLGLEKFVSLAFIVPMQAIAIIIQFIKPDLLCEMFCTALALLLIMLTIQRPDAKNDVVSGLYKQSAFDETIKLSTSVHKSFAIIYIHSVNHGALSSYLPLKSMRLLTRLVGQKLIDIAYKYELDATAYNLEEGNYSMIITDDDMAKLEDVAGTILEDLNKDFEVFESTISVPFNICTVKMPEEIGNLDSLILLEKDINQSKYSYSVVSASELTAKKNYVLMSKMDAILKKAIEDQSFEVYYQPIYSLKDNRFNSAEALIRLNTEEFGFIRPDLFIPIAEETGLIHKIDMLVFRKVCEFISGDEFEKLGLDYIEVNLSVAQCMRDNLSSELLSVMNEYQIAHSKINLEITETAAEYSQKNILSNVNSLHSNGINFSLDDFGTGYSNMIRIASLPINIIKLDKSFTWADKNSELSAILENTISMAKKMDLEIVVEGVETKDMLERFHKLECEYIQGFYFSKPLPKDQFIQFIDDTRDKNWF